MTQQLDIENIYEKRFDERVIKRKQRIWQVLCRHYFQRYVNHADTVLDLGAGQCEFINNIDCERRIAVELNPKVRDYAGEDVQVYITSITDLTPVESESVHVVFASNIFEHLPEKEALMVSLREVARVLRSGGKLLILQPNIRLLGGKYWDFIDHVLPITDRTITEALDLVNMNILQVRRRFLPYTYLGTLPQHPYLVRLYLMLPILQWLFGKQSWIVAEKS